MTKRDLFDDADGAPLARPTAQARRSRSFSSWQAALAGAIREHGQPVTWHEYRRADGVLVGGVARFATANGGKTVRQASTADGGRSWSPTAFPEPRPLLYVADVLQAERVLVVEGEKCADALRSLGYVATTSPGGSKAASKADWSTLTGKSVVILPDHDDPGESYGDDVAKFATEAGAADARVVRLADHWPDCPEGGDVADWIEAQGDAAEPDALRASLDAIVATAVTETVAHRADARPLEWEPFPVELLPDPVGTFVAEVAARISTDATLVAFPMLASVAATIGNRRRIELWPGWLEPPILWMAGVAAPGSNKSEAATKSLAFIRQRQHDAFTAHGAAMADWEAEKREHDRASRRRDADAGPPPERPTAERVLVDDITIETLGPILQANPNGLLVARDELSGWFDFDRYSGGKGGGEAARWLSCYGAAPLTVDRKLSGTFYVPAAAVSIVGTIQPRVLARVVGTKHIDNGLLQRFVVAAPPRRMKEIPSGEVDFATVEAVRSMFAMLAAIRPAEDGSPLVLDLEPLAAEEWRTFYRGHAAAQFNASGPVGEMLSKAEAWGARLALVCHMIRQAGTQPTLGHRIDADSIRRGIGLARWAAREWQRVFEGMARGSIEADDRALLDFIRDRGGVATVRDVARHGPAAYRAPGTAEAGLARIARSGQAEWQTITTGGRPADAVRLR
jgi:hypothetical protein